MIDLFDIIINRTLIRHKEHNFIDKICLFAAFRIILFCDEIHDFGKPDKDLNYDTKLIEEVKKERLLLLHKDIIWFLQKFNFTNIDEIIKILNDKFNKEQRYSLNDHTEYIKYILNSRTYLTILILQFYKQEKDNITDSSKIKQLLSNIINFLSVEGNKALIYELTINENNCKILVEKLVENIFGIKQMPYNYCKTLEQINILNAVNEKNGNKLSKVALFIDQIGASKNYCSVTSVIAKIIQDFRETGKINQEIFLINTLASKYDSSSTTAIDRIIDIIIKKEEYVGKGINAIDDSNSNDPVISFQNNKISLQFAKVDIITFKFDNLNLTIDRYFSHEINETRTGGSNYIYNNSSVSSIKKSIVENTNNIKLICFKTMGDFLQIINTKLYENNLGKDFGTVFITGDVIAGNIAGLILKSSILEKQTDKKDNLIIVDSLFMFYNIKEILNCVIILDQFYKFPIKKRSFFYNKLREIYAGEHYKDYRNYSYIIKGPSTPGPSTPGPSGHAKRKKDSEIASEIATGKKTKLNPLSIKGRVFYDNIFPQVKNYTPEEYNSPQFDNVLDTKISEMISVFGRLNNQEKDLIKQHILFNLRELNKNNFGKKRYTTKKENTNTKKIKIDKIIKNASIKLGIKIKTKRDILHIDKIIKLAKKYRVPINKKTVQNLKKTLKIHNIAKKMKIRLTLTTKNNKRIYKTPNSLIKEIKKIKEKRR